MGKVKWIKISTDLFEDEKINYILTLPEGNLMLVLWLRILTLAGKSNCSGYIMLTEKIPYTEEMLVQRFGIDNVRWTLFFETFKRLGILEVSENGALFVANWDKHQSLDRLDSLREYDRKRKQISRKRAKIKLLSAGQSVDGPMDVPADGPLTVHMLDIDIDNKEINKEKSVDVVENKTRSKPSKQERHRYGEYGHVLLTDEDMKALEESDIDHLAYIEDVDSYCERSGKTYKNYRAAIRTFHSNALAKGNPKFKKNKAPEKSNTFPCPVCGEQILTSAIYHRECGWIK